MVFTSLAGAVAAPAGRGALVGGDAVRQSAKLAIVGVLAAVGVGLTSPSPAQARTAPWYAACHPLNSPGSVRVLFQSYARTTTLERQWRRMICSAARDSTVSLALMFLHDNGPATHRLVRALRWVHYHRDVQVRVLVQRGHYYHASSWRKLKRELHFARLYSCWYGCHSARPQAHAHAKFMILSRTIFGGSAVLESSANWSQGQFEGQRESGVYFYDIPALYAGYLAEWRSLVNRSPNSPAVWTAAGHGVSYTFDPHAESDPTVSELRTLTCRAGDLVEIANSKIRRISVVKELNLLQRDGCTVRAVVQRRLRGLRPRSHFAVRTTRIHDRFLVIHAHTGTGAAVDEVIAGSELCRWAALRLSDNQLVRLRREDAYRAYRRWFAHLWAVAR
jgi:hypothetical protein